MPPVQAKFTSWSFSRYQDYTTCPARAKWKHLDKIQEPPNEAMDRGSKIHTMAEHYLKGRLSTLPPELKAFGKELRTLQRQYKSDPASMVVEDTWAFRKNWTRTTWNDWAECWLRIKLDLAHFEDGMVLTITDFKTGRFREEKSKEYMEQLDLYALGALLIFQDRDNITVTPRLMYLDEGVVYPGSGARVYTGADLKELKKRWADRVRAMFSDKKFAPTPNYSCRWCFYSKAKGGPCKF